MMDIVKDFFSNIAGPAAEYAKRYGGDGADLAKRLGGTSAELAKRFGGGSVDLAKQLGDSAADIAKRVGTKRALIGLALIGAAVGGVVLVRYLRSRDDEAADLEANEEPGTAAGRRNRKQTRAKRKADNNTGVTH